MLALLSKIAVQAQLKEVSLLEACSKNNLEIFIASIPKNVDKIEINRFRFVDLEQTLVLLLNWSVQ